MIGLLDRYLLGQWVRIFLLAALGLPIVSVLVELTDTLNSLLERNLTPGAIVLSSLYGIPEAVSLMMPAAALFATVFTMGPFSRHSELTAAKAMGRSLPRLVVPLLAASIVASVLAFLVGEYATEAKTRQLELRKEREVRSVRSRYNFVYRADENYTYTVRTLDLDRSRLDGLQIERLSRRPDRPSEVVLADSATYTDSTGWVLYGGATHFYRAEGLPVSVTFRTARLRVLDERPRDLLVETRDPGEMAYGELGRYIATLKRSGNDTRKLEVNHALKLALPAACFVIALFAAPLAITSPRAGAAVGVAIALGTTVAYLLLINLTQAFGSTGLVDPIAAAWLPNLLFFAAGGTLLLRART